MAVIPKETFVPVEAKPIRQHIKILLYGTPGGGKSFTAIEFAAGLSKSKIGVIDTEKGRISDYADKHNFLVITLDEAPQAPEWYRCHPDRILNAYNALVKAGCDVIILDSLSDMWAYTLLFKNALDIEYKMPAKAAGEAFGAFDKTHDRLTNDAIHVIVTCKETVETNKETRVTTAAPKLRGKAEYNYDFVMRMEDGGKATVTKTQLPEFQGKKISQPTAEIAKGLLQHKLKKVQAVSKGENK